MSIRIRDLWINSKDCDCLPLLSSICLSITIDSQIDGND